MRNLQWVLNTLAKFRLDMITLTLSKDRICLFVRKNEKLFRASLRPVYTVQFVGRFCPADKSYRVNCVKLLSSKELPVVCL